MRGIARIVRPAAARAGLALGLLLGASACSNTGFDVPNNNTPTLSSITDNPTRAKLASVATGIVNGAREDMVNYVWFLGTFGREGYNFLGNDPRSTGESLRSLDASSFIGGGIWLSRYANIRLINVYLTALKKTLPDLTTGEVAASRGFANTYKALAFYYLVATHQQLGAPVDVSGDPASPTIPPFVNQDGVYQAIQAQLDSAITDLDAAVAAGASFPFPLPGTMSAFGDPASFEKFNRALYAKVLIMRATEAAPPSPTTLFVQALAVLNDGETFIDPAGSLQAGAYHPFSPAAGDIANSLGDPLNSITFFVHPSFEADAKLQADGVTPDNRFVTKTADFTDGTRTLDGLSSSKKWTVYFSGGAANLSAPIAIIRNEELILLRAEANIALNNLEAARQDLNVIRTVSGNLAPIAPGGLTAGNAIDELLYNRRYSLAWEQGTRWIDARRYGRLGTLPLDRTDDATFPRMPIPQAECQARGLTVVAAIGCNPGSFPLN